VIDEDEYEGLKAKHNKLSREFDFIKKNLERWKVYGRFKKLMDKLGLDFEDYRNVDEIAPRLLKEWDDSPGSFLLI